MLGLFFGFVSSLRCGRVLFRIYPQDHEPRHVHGFIGNTEVIVDLGMDGAVRLAVRSDGVRQGDAKRSDVHAVLDTAAENCDELVLLWEKMHA